MEKPVIEKLPTAQMIAFCQVFGLPDGSKEEMVEYLNKVPAASWAGATVKFKVDQL